MKLSEIISAIEETAPLSLQEDWDNAGLCIGSPDAEITGAVTALDCTPELMAEAVEKGANLIITHHPLVFGGIKKITDGDPVSDMIVYAIRNGLNVYSAHTNMDKARGGVSWLMAERLGLEECRPLDEGGLGIIGHTAKEYSPQEFTRLLKERFGTPTVRISGTEGIRINRVALCGGSGASLIGKAVSEGADIYVSGDISYHHFFTRKGFMIADIGHYESEMGIVDLFISIVRKNFPNFAIWKSEKSNNPVYYI